VLCGARDTDIPREVQASICESRSDRSFLLYHMRTHFDFVAAANSQFFLKWSWPAGRQRNALSASRVMVWYSHTVRWARRNALAEFRKVFDCRRWRALSDKVHFCALAGHPRRSRVRGTKFSFSYLRVADSMRTAEVTAGADALWYMIDTSPSIVAV
jgi:hypothetical protein